MLMVANANTLLHVQLFVVGEHALWIAPCLWYDVRIVFLGGHCHDTTVTEFTLRMYLLYFLTITHSLPVR
jgi:hypothetical protein